MDELDARLIVSCFQFHGISKWTKRLGVTKFLNRHVTDQVYEGNVSKLLLGRNVNIFYAEWLQAKN